MAGGVAGGLGVTAAGIGPGGLAIGGGGSFGVLPGETGGFGGPRVVVGPEVDGVVPGSVVGAVRGPAPTVAWALPEVCAADEVTPVPQAATVKATTASAGITDLRMSVSQELIA